MAKRRTGTIQEILDKEYAAIRQRNTRPYIDGRKLIETALRTSRRMKAWWTAERRKEQSIRTTAYYDKHGRKPKKFRPAKTANDYFARREQQKADIARWQKEIPND